MPGTTAFAVISAIFCRSSSSAEEEQYNSPEATSRPAFRLFDRLVRFGDALWLLGTVVTGTIIAGRLSLSSDVGQSIRMKRKIVINNHRLFPLAACRDLFVSCASSSSQGLSGPVSVSVQGYKTNQTSGQVTTIFAITNGGPHDIRFAIGTQIRQSSGWADSVSGSSNQFNLSIDSDPVILADEAIGWCLWEFPATAFPWRVYALCQKEYPEHWSKSLRSILTATS